MCLGVPGVHIDQLVVFSLSFLNVLLSKRGHLELVGVMALQVCDAEMAASRLYSLMYLGIMCVERAAGAERNGWIHTMPFTL